MTFVQPVDQGRLSQVLHGHHSEVAAGVGTSRQRIQELASGRAPRTRIRLAAAIEDFLGIPRGSLFTLNPDETDLIAQYLSALRSAP